MKVTDFSTSKRGNSTTGKTGGGFFYPIFTANNLLIYQLKCRYRTT
jgi:hypothetical protein